MPPSRASFCLKPEPTTGSPCATPSRPHDRPMIDLTPPPPPTQAQLRRDAQRFHRVLIGVAVFVVALAALWWGEHQFNVDLHAFAIRPRAPEFLIGVLTAPLLHGSLEHLLGNSFGLFMLGTLAIYRYPQGSKWAIPLIWLIAGIGTWWIGRTSFHIGASGVTHGLMFFVFVSGLIRRDRTSIAAALLAFAFFGGMLVTILPREPGVSWEYHLTGAIGGIVAAILVRKRDPAPARRKYSWEIEEELEREAQRRAAELELHAPEDIAPIWEGPNPPAISDDDRRGVVLQFPVRERGSDERLH